MSFPSPRLAGLPSWGIPTLPRNFWTQRGRSSVAILSFPSAGLKTYWRCLKTSDLPKLSISKAQSFLPLCLKHLYPLEVPRLNWDDLTRSHQIRTRNHPKCHQKQTINDREKHPKHKFENLSGIIQKTITKLQLTWNPPQHPTTATPPSKKKRGTSEVGLSAGAWSGRIRNLSDWKSRLWYSMGLWVNRTSPKNAPPWSKGNMNETGPCRGFPWTSHGR